MNRTMMTVVVASLVLAATACGDDDLTYEPVNPVDQGELQRQACVDAGKIVLIRDRIVVGCVTVEQYNQMSDFHPQDSTP